LSSISPSVDEVKKGIACRNGCQTIIHFDKSTKSPRGKFIPLNPDGSTHNCPNSGQQFAVDCYYCGNRLTFNDRVRSKSGKCIPLDEDGSHHECTMHPYNQLTQEEPKIGEESEVNEQCFP
jgi:hypothetical protein